MTSALPERPHLLLAVKQRVRAAQYRALQQVNHPQIKLYQVPNQFIAEHLHPHGWGKGVVATLARDLQTELPDGPQRGLA